VIRLLGPLTVEVDGEPVPLTSVKQKAILALLALHGAQTTELAELIAGLWGENPPATAKTTIQVHVSALRRALGRAGSLIETRPPGYRLAGADVDVDVLRFERLAGEGRQGRPDRWREALEEWTGEAALADLAGGPVERCLRWRPDSGDVRAGRLLGWDGLGVRQLGRRQGLLLREREWRRARREPGSLQRVACPFIVEPGP
jgi:DNA-binding SARP family transcriptional activator